MAIGPAALGRGLHDMMDMRYPFNNTPFVAQHFRGEQHFCGEQPLFVAQCFLGVGCAALRYGHREMRLSGVMEAEMMMRIRKAWAMFSQTLPPLLVLGLLMLVLSLLLTGCYNYGWGPGMMDRGGFWYSGWGIAMGIAMLLFWGLIIAGGVALVVWLIRQAGATPSGGGSRPLDILQERYAKGEITREQYEQMRRDLEGR